MPKILTSVGCHVGDVVIHNGEKFVVNEILYDDLRTPGKSVITACRILPDTGQVLRRSPKYIGSNWKPIDMEVTK